MRCLYLQARRRGGTVRDQSKLTRLYVVRSGELTASTSQGTHQVRAALRAIRAHRHYPPRQVDRMHCQPLPCTYPPSSLPVPCILMLSIQAAVEIMQKHGAETMDRPRMIAAGEIMAGGMRTLFVGAGDRIRKLRRCVSDERAGNTKLQTQCALHCSHID